jgi:hypothetical protein
VRVPPQARNSRIFDGRPACCASASCIPICPVQAKYDATVHLKKAKAAGARVLSDSVAVRLDVGPDDHVSGIVIRRPDRSETELQARLRLRRGRRDKKGTLRLLSLRRLCR